jgi:hypothetical protein
MELNGGTWSYLLLEGGVVSMAVTEKEREKVIKESEARREMAKSVIEKALNAKKPDSPKKK